MFGFAAGQLIKLADGRHARIRFIGTTRFAPGEWIGLELEDATGKNDGSVQGERYFECEYGFGMFVRASAIVGIVEQARKEEPRVAPKSGLDGRGRPGSMIVPPGGAVGTRRQSLMSSTPGGKNSSSAASSPSPAPRALGRALRSPTKSPVKQLAGPGTPAASRASSTASRTIPSHKARPSLSNRSSAAPTPTSTTSNSRLSLRQSQSQSTMGPPAKTTRTGLAASRTTISPATSRRMSLKPATAKSPVMGKVEAGSGEQSEDASRASSPPDGPELDVVKPSLARPTPSPMSQRSVSGSNMLVQKELDDLKTKLKIMEKKRAEDREKLKMVETYRAERDKFETIIQKLREKYQPQQQEITTLRKQLKEAEYRVEEVERLQAEHESILEMAALDREMAEEVAESIKAEYEALKIRTEELELEVEVLKEENDQLGQVMSPEEKSSQGWLQMERTNERLREALIRLRDMTQQQEADLKDQVKELEEELKDYNNLKAQYESTKEKLLASEANMEDLKQQVEALGAEEMIEELTEKNMQYQEEVNELKAIIEDLESLKELNDELEINHIESEKQLQEEIDFREGIYHEQNRKISQQDAVIEDLEYTLSKFRELVSTLQNDLEDMRASQQITETEATDLTVRSRAMMDLNMKLQASAAKAQVGWSRESASHLSIVKLYLPDYYESERNPILALLRFKRVGFKASVMGNAIRERLADPSIRFPERDGFLAYEVLEKLTWISLVCDKFVTFMDGCSSEQFSSFEGALYELEPVERILNFWIESLKKGELNEKTCADELQRSTALLSHLAETLIPQHVEGTGNEMYMLSVLTQTYLDNTASALAQLKSKIQSKIPPSPEDEESQHLYKKIDTVVQQARGIKVASSKVTRSLEELRTRSLALAEECKETFESTKQAAKELSAVAQLIGNSFLQLVDDDDRTEPFTYPEVLTSMSDAVASIPKGSPGDSGSNDALAIIANKLRLLTGYVDETSNLSSDLSQTVEFDRRQSPWIARSKMLKASQEASPDAEEEIRRLKNELSEASNALGAKDRVFEEQSIKIELLEARMREAGKKAAVVKDLEAKIENLHSKENELVALVERQSQNMQAIERERDEYRSRFEKLKRASDSEGSSGIGGVVNAAASLSVMKENEALRAEVTSLQSAIRYIRDDNKRAHLLDPYSVQRSNHMRSWLDVPLVRSKPSINEQDPDHRHKQAAECRDVLSHLLKLTKESKLVDLKASSTSDPANRLAWRPVKSTPKYHAMKQREHYEQWSQWKDEVVKERKMKKLNAGSGTTRRDWPTNNPGAPASFSVDHAAFPDISRKGLAPDGAEGVMGKTWKILGLQPDTGDIPRVSNEPQILDD
ncbi:dynactin [Trichophyton equinum CBS 127.97]|uniref:Dynactin n=1 Tax=Trichophyton equinum (strain ATCC MYA-4606 / CBS 127.97) TaxID=559882 RepID=F2PJV1_TRIEC|nr:dynactin [Trichophyton equinum CBS 127.97]